MTRRNAYPRKVCDSFIRAFSLLATALALALMGWIIYMIIREGYGAISWELLTNKSRPFGEAEGGIANALLGTVVITAGAAIMAIPLAIAAGIGLAEFGGTSRFAAVCRFAINLMMGIPSVIAGLFVYGIIVVTTGHFSGFAGSVALAILMFAVVERTTEDQLSLVSVALRESALALGISRTRVTLQIICRAAKNGMLTGILLAVARVSGETAPLLFTALFADNWPANYFGGPTPSVPVLITNYTLDSPFESMQRIGWSSTLVMSVGILTINIVVRYVSGSKK